MRSHKKNILVVEDDTHQRLAITQKLDHEGFNTFEAHNASEGLALALEKHPDLILLDIVMPVMDGITMLGELRKDSWGARVPVILLTNLNDASMVAKGQQHGVYDYLVKTDWKLEDVVGVVRKKIGADI